MNKRLALLLVTLAISIFSACAAATRADEHTMSKASLTPAAEALPKAAKLYSERSNPDNVRKALEILQGARNPDKRDFRVENDFAKYSYFLGSRETTDEKEADKVLKEGLVAARIARRLEPNKPDGYFWAAAILGEQSKRAPITVGITSVDKIRDGLNKSIEIDPGFQAASGYLGLGQLELNTRGMAGGSAEKAVEYLEKGLETSKDNSYIYLYLAEAYFAVDRDEDAKRVIADLRALKPDPDYIPEHEEALKKAEKMMKEKAE
jgi:tetratricopeptide (TPR) repeat protein